MTEDENGKINRKIWSYGRREFALSCNMTITWHTVELLSTQNALLVFVLRLQIDCIVVLKKGEYFAPEQTVLGISNTGHRITHIFPQISKPSDSKSRINHLIKEYFEGSCCAFGSEGLTYLFQFIFPKRPNRLNWIDFITPYSKGFVLLCGNSPSPLCTLWIFPCINT